MNIDFNSFTEKSALAVQEAQNLAGGYGQQEIDVWHLIVSLVTQENGIVPGLLERMHILPSALQLATERELEKLPKASGSVNASQVYISSALQKVFVGAEKWKAQFKDDFVSTEHLFLGLLQSDKLDRFFYNFGIGAAKVEATLKAMLGDQKVTSRTPESSFEALEKYGIDLVEMARKGKMDPVIGRDDEIREQSAVLFSVQEDVLSMQIAV